MAAGEGCKIKHYREKWKGSLVAKKRAIPQKKPTEKIEKIRGGVTQGEGMLKGKEEKKSGLTLDGAELLSPRPARESKGKKYDEDAKFKIGKRRQKANKPGPKIFKTKRNNPSWEIV